MHHNTIIDDKKKHIEQVKQSWQTEWAEVQKEATKIILLSTDWSLIFFDCMKPFDIEKKLVVLTFIWLLTWLEIGSRM
jgi:hypothetical protein